MFNPVFESSRLPDQFQQVNETMYYDALSQPLYDYKQPTAYNNFEYSSINTGFPTFNQNQGMEERYSNQMPIPHPYLSDMGQSQYPLPQEAQWQAAGHGEMFCQTPVTETRYNPPQDSGYNPSCQISGGGFPCSGGGGVYYNESINSSGYSSECNSTPEYQIPHSMVTPLHGNSMDSCYDDNIACRLDWSDMLEDTTQSIQESSKELDEIMSLLKEHLTEPTPEPTPLSQPSTTVTLNRRRNKRPCPSPETGKHAKKSRRVCPEPRRYNTPTVTVLSTWLRNNLKNPYPTISEKKELMKKTGLDRGQIRQWFVNARRRYAREGRRPIKTTR
ncbi:uncharacterized protein LOC134818998 isoform X2 [Bolinopsis microptera]